MFPLILGEWFNLTNIFQMGWKHQPLIEEVLSNVPRCTQQLVKSWLKLPIYRLAEFRSSTAWWVLMCVGWWFSGFFNRKGMLVPCKGYPPWELTYPTYGKETSSSKVPWEEDMLLPWRVAFERWDGERCLFGRFQMTVEQKPWQGQEPRNLDHE